MLRIAGRNPTSPRKRGEVNQTSPIRFKAILLYRPRGAPNIRDNSQTGITITAPSRK
jgi:hypothetical protein